MQPTRQQVIQRPVPFSAESEEAVLGSLLLDPSKIVQVAQYLKSDDFYREKNAWVFEGLLRLYHKDTGVDTLTLADELEMMGRLEAVGDVGYLTGLINCVPTAIHADHYGRIVERNSLLRRLIGACESIAKMAYNNPDESADSVSLRAKCEMLIAEAFRGQSRKGPRHISAALQEICDEIVLMRQAKVSPGLPSSINAFTRITGGYHRGEQTILAARSGIGKSSFMIQESLFLAQQGYKVYVASLEMTDKAVGRRLIAHESGIPVLHLRNGLGDAYEDEWDRLEQDVYDAIGPLGELSIYVDEEPRQSAVEIGIKAKALAAEVGGIDLFIVDYLGLVRLDGKGETAHRLLIGQASRYFRELARELNCHNITLHQLNRLAANETPALHHISDSDEIVKHADIVTFLHDPVKAGQEKAIPNSPYKKIQLLVAKNRNGETSYTELLMHGVKQEWKEAAPDWMAEQEPVQKASKQGAKPVAPKQYNGNGRNAPLMPPAYDVDEMDF